MCRTLKERNRFHAYICRISLGSSFRLYACVLCVCIPGCCCLVFFRIHLLYFWSLHLTIDGRSPEICEISIPSTLDSFFSFVQSNAHFLSVYLIFLLVKLSLLECTQISHFRHSICKCQDHFCIYPPLTLC